MTCEFSDACMCHEFKPECLLYSQRDFDCNSMLTLHPYTELLLQRVPVHDSLKRAELSYKEVIKSSLLRLGSHFSVKSSPPTQLFPTLLETVYSHSLPQNKEFLLSLRTQEELQNCFFLPNGAKINLSTPLFVENFVQGLKLSLDQKLFEKEITKDEYDSAVMQLLLEMTQSKHLLLRYRDYSKIAIVNFHEIAHYDGTFPFRRAFVEHGFLLKLGNHKSSLIPLPLAEYIKAYETLCSISADVYGRKHFLQEISDGASAKYFSIHLLSRHELHATTSVPLYQHVCINANLIRKCVPANAQRNHITSRMSFVEYTKQIASMSLLLCFSWIFKKQNFLVNLLTSNIFREKTEHHSDKLQVLQYIESILSMVF